MSISSYLIIAIIIAGALFILASRKKRASLDTPLLSSHALFVIGFSLIFAGVCSMTVIFLKG